MVIQHIKTIFTFFLFIPLMADAQKKGELIYIGDPMCSWCYGFAPELDKVQLHYEGELELRLIMGGLRPYNTEKITDLSDFLRQHWEEVGARSGQTFSFEILADDSMIYDTEPSCRAVCLMKELYPAMAYPYFKAIQKTFYAQNQNTTSIDVLAKTAEQMGINRLDFEELFESVSLKSKVKEDFEIAQKMGVRGFPSMVLKYKDKYYWVSRGYQESPQLIRQIDEILDGN